MLYTIVYLAHGNRVNLRYNNNLMSENKHQVELSINSFESIGWGMGFVFGAVLAMYLCQGCVAEITTNIERSRQEVIRSVNK